MRYEFKLWVFHILKWLPGILGALIRAAAIPFESIGRNVVILDGVHIDFPSRLRLGNNVSINRGCTINAGGHISIDDNVLIGPGVVIYSQNHNFNSTQIPIRLQGYTYKPTIIEANVWIAANSIILPGVTIGEGSVVGAGSVVTKSVPKSSLVGGNPAKILRQI